MRVLAHAHDVKHIVSALVRAACSVYLLNMNVAAHGKLRAPAFFRAQQRAAEHLAVTCHVHRRTEQRSREPSYQVERCTARRI